MPLFANIYTLVAFLARSARRFPSAKVLLGAVVFAGVVAGVGNIVLLSVVNRAIGHVGSPERALVWTFVAVCATLPVARFVSEFLLIVVLERVAYGLRLDVSRRVLATPLRQLEGIGVPRLLAAFTEDIPTIAGAITFVPALCMSLAVVVGGLGYMAWLSRRLFLVVLAVLAIAIVSYQLPMLHAQRSFHQLRDRYDALFEHFRALTSGIKELQLHGRRRTAFLDECLGPTANALRQHSLAAHRVYAAAVSWGQTLAFVLLGFLVLVAPGRFGMTPTVVTGFVLTTLYMLTPMAFITTAIPHLARAVVAVRKVDGLGLALAPAPCDTVPAPVSGTPRWHILELVGVTHTYTVEGDQTPFTLGPVDLAVRPGELVFITGGNGSGKTTLAKVLTALYEPQAGDVRLDGAHIGPAEVNAYRDLFSAIFSDYHLFSRLLGLEGQGLDASARRYLDLLRLDHVVTVNDRMLSTTDVSQGQRKRLALLTAYLEDRPIYVFDEWAADQDPVFRDVFYLQLLPQLADRGKAVIVITHDDRYYAIADRVLKLEYGRVVSDSRQPGVRSAPSAEMARILTPVR